MTLEIEIPARELCNQLLHFGSIQILSGRKKKTQKTPTQKTQKTSRRFWSKLKPQHHKQYFEPECQHQPSLKNIRNWLCEVIYIIQYSQKCLPNTQILSIHLNKNGKFFFIFARKTKFRKVRRQGKQRTWSRTWKGPRLWISKLSL